MKVTLIAPEERPVVFEPGSIWQRHGSDGSTLYVMVVQPSMSSMVAENTVWYVYLGNDPNGISIAVGRMYQRSEAEFRSMFTQVGTPVELKVQP